MLNIVTFFKALVSTIGAFFEWKHDEALRQDGANKAELEGRKAEDALIDTINNDLADDELRDSVEEEYTIK